MRRFIAILSLILLSHLLGAGDSACASHAGHMAGEDQSLSQHDRMSMGLASAPAVDESSGACIDHEDNCPAPTKPTCCKAMASCAAMFVGGVMADGPLTLHGAGNPSSDLLAASSGLSSPETPPPRA